MITQTKDNKVHIGCRLISPIELNDTMLLRTNINRAWQTPDSLGVTAIKCNISHNGVSLKFKPSNSLPSHPKTIKQR